VDIDVHMLMGRTSVSQLNMPCVEFFFSHVTCNASLSFERFQMDSFSCLSQDNCTVFRVHRKVAINMLLLMFLEYVRDSVLFILLVLLSLSF
jgi:hypothetical protein